MSGTLSVLVLRALHGAVARAGADADALLAEFGVSPDLLRNSEARLPATIVFGVFVRAPEITGDECFCLRAADAIPIGTIDVVDFAMRSSANMGEVLARVCRYYALIDDRSQMSIEKAGGLARLVGSRTTSPSPRAATELLFALILARGRQLTGRDWPLREVSFSRGPPTDPRGHERFFGVPVRFKRPRNELVFDAAWLEVPSIMHDAALATFLDRHADGLLERLPGPATFLDEVKLAIAETMRGSDPGLEVTAKRLATSARTLQRRLHELGTAHKDLVEEVRRDLAFRLLADPSIGIGEVAYLLGFFDASTFHRAFKRWTSSTPSDYREAALKRAP